MGDDVNDLGAMAIAGVSAAPANARPDVLAVVGFRPAAHGGDGAVRQLVDTILSSQVLTDNQHDRRS